MTMKRCVARIHIAQTDTFNRRIMREKRKNMGIPEHQCGKEAIYAFDNQPLCRMHAGQRALWMSEGINGWSKGRLVRIKGESKRRMTTEQLRAAFHSELRWAKGLYVDALDVETLALFEEAVKHGFAYRQYDCNGAVLGLAKVGLCDDC